MIENHVGIDMCCKNDSKNIVCLCNNNSDNSCSCNKHNTTTVIRNISELCWEEYPSPKESGFGHGKFCYYLSSTIADLPIRKKEKAEPHYEDMTYNVYASCNQRSIKRAKGRGISYLIFYTRYNGNLDEYRGRYFITGLFPISAKCIITELDNRFTYLSKNLIFLSIEDSICLNNNKWQEWFDIDIPTDKHGYYNLRWMSKFVKRSSQSLIDILNHFKKNSNKNKLSEYIKEPKS